MIMLTDAERAANRRRSVNFARLAVDIGAKEDLIFYGDTIGHASSKSDTHTHPLGELPDGRCSVCRWIDQSLYRFQYLVEPPPTWVDRHDLDLDMFGTDVERAAYPVDRGDSIWYMMIGVGNTILDGEVTKYTVHITPSAFELIELGTFYNRTSGTSYIPIPTARVFAQAADKDEKIKDAYVNRAVV